ncbi:MAG: ester cyclase [Anaerolineae bacterium]
MSEQENLILVRRYFDEFLNKRDLDLADRIIAPDFTHNLHGFGDTNGREAWKQTIQVIVDAMPDAHWTVEEVVAQGDTVVMRWTFTGTHSGAEWAGWPATGSKISTPMVAFFYFAEGKISSGRTLADSLDMWQQFGVIPPLAEMIEQAKNKA